MAAVLALEGVADSQRQLSALFFPVYFHTHRLTGGDRALPCKATCPTSLLLSLSRSQRRKIACGWTNQLSTWRFVRFTTSPSRVSPAGCRFNSVTQLLLDYFSVRRESIWFFFNMGKNGNDRSSVDPNFQQVSLQWCYLCAYSNKIKIGVTLRDGFFLSDVMWFLFLVGAWKLISYYLGNEVNKSALIKVIKSNYVAFEQRLRKRAINKCAILKL